jgi:hypothetical protein
LKKKTNIWTKLIKGLFKVSLVITLCVFLLFFLVAGAVQVPTIQNYIVGKATEYAEEVTGYKTSIEGIHIDWFDLLVLEEAVLWDEHNAKMIYLGEAEIDYTIISLFKGHLYFDNITLRDGEINLIRYKNEDGINITEFIWKIQELTTPKVKRKGPPIPVEIPKFTLDNMLFSYNDQREKLMEEDYFDHNHFTLDSIHGVVTNLYAVLDTIMLDAHGLTANLRESHLNVKELNTSFLLDKHQIECSKLYAKVGNSELHDYFRFEYKDINDMSDFNTAVDVTVRLKESTIATKDIAHFAPSLKGINDRIFISGKMKGRVNRFSVDSLNAYFGRVGHIKGKMTFDGLPDVSETFMDINLKELNVTALDILQYAGPSSHSFLNKFGMISGKGRFTGLVNDFALKGNFNTGIGHLASDINFKIYDNNDKSKYEGSLSTENFDLGKFLGYEIVQKIDMTGTIKGQGFSINSAAIKLDARINRLGLYNYDYKNIVTDAILADNFFDGHINIKDSNLVLTATGKINMKAHPEEFDIDGKIEKANLEKLNLTKVMTHLSTDFNLDFRGTDIDSILGEAHLANTNLVSNEKQLFLKALSLSVNKEGSNRTIDLNSDILDADMTGNFSITELVSDANTLFDEFKLFYSHDKKQIASYYSAKPKTIRRNYKSEFTFNLKNVNNLIDLYYPGIYIAQKTLVKGEFASGKTSRFELYSSVDSMFYNGNELYKNTIDVSLSKLVDGPDVMATAYIKSDQQNFKNSFKTEKFVFESQWSDDEINFATAIAQKDNTNKLILNGILTLKDTSANLVFKNSHLDILEDEWSISDSNSIDFNKNNLTFNYLRFFNKKQSIKIIGDFSTQADKQASFIVENFKLKNLNPIMDYKLEGVLDGQLKVRNIYKDLDLDGGLTVKKFTLDGFVFGDINATADWMENEQHLNLNIDVLRDNFKAINIVGNIKPPTEDRKEIISLLAHFNSADLGFISPVLKGVMSEISGTVTGSLKISGSLRDLRLKGEADVEDGKFKVDYLGALYTFSDKIYFTEDQIKFKNTTLVDENGNKAVIKGGIAYDGFKNFLVDIKGNFKNFNVLNTTEADNSRFYGVVNATGDFSLFGPFDDLQITANAKSERNTRIYIPLTGESEVSRKEFIRFVKKDTLDPNLVANQDNSRIRMFFNMEITPDAYTEIIFDKRTGDIIRGRGDGNIELRFDTKGEMAMYGNYTIKEGWYNFAMAGIIPKEFTIDKGSRISWSGDPYEGMLDIKAKYHQDVSLKPLFDTTFRSRPDLQRYYPTDVVLGVKGNLSAPEITMDIDILRYPSDPQLSTVVTDFEAKIKTNDQELNRQVFSLIMLRSFTAPNSFIGVSSVGTNNVSELLSGQLSHFLSQADQNLEVNLNLNNLDKDALNTLNVRLSYTTMEGRLRISRNGNFQNAQASSQANISNIAGEWTVEYQLSQDGNFRMKLFNRINNNSLISSTGTTNTSAGLSLMHVQSFDGLREFFGRRKRKRELEEKNIPPADSIIVTPVVVPDTLLTK